MVRSSSQVVAAGRRLKASTATLPRCAAGTQHTCPLKARLDTLQKLVEPAVVAPEVHHQYPVLDQTARGAGIELRGGELGGLRTAIETVHQDHVTALRVMRHPRRAIPLDHLQPRAV